MITIPPPSLLVQLIECDRLACTQDAISAMARTRDRLTAALKDAGTQQLLASARHDAIGNYWCVVPALHCHPLTCPLTAHIISFRDDFLGDYNGVERGEDRMFSTALAINTLIDVWSVPATYAFTQCAMDEFSISPVSPTICVALSSDSSCKLRWAKNIPASVQPLVYGGVTYLRTYLLSGQFSLGNAFFSGSEKVLTPLPLKRKHSSIYSFNKPTQ